MDKVRHQVCIDNEEVRKTRNKIFSPNTYKYLQQVFLFQLCIGGSVALILERLLHPLGITRTVAQILGGISVGPSGLGLNSQINDLMNPGVGTHKLQTLGSFGCMMYLFLVGVRMDVSTVKRASRKAWVIGMSTFIIPLVISVSISFNLKNYFTKKFPKTKFTRKVAVDFPMIATLGSLSSFHVISCLLSDLKILNTELGRLATSVSTISGMCGWITVTIMIAVQENHKKETKILFSFLLSSFALIIVIVVLIRKYAVWLVKQSPQGGKVKEIYLFTIFLVVLGTGYIGESIGLHNFFGPMLLGLAIPEGPPLGSFLEDKLECFISALLMPIFYLNVGSKVQVRTLYENPKILCWTLACLSLGFFGKLIAAIIPCLYYKLPFRDAVALGLILSTLGIFDLAVYIDAVSREKIDSASFASMAFGLLIIATVTSTLVHWLFNPSKTYSVVKKGHTIQNIKEDTEFRVLVCIYNQENVPTIVDLIEASNPTKKSPIYIYLLHLLELEGRSNPVMISHQPNDKLFDKSSPSYPIINRFRIYEKQNRGVVILHPFTTITPFVTAYEDICTMALDKKTNLLVIPFHKQWNIDGIKESSKCRNISKKVLPKAPCSVGILIDRGRLNEVKSVLCCWSTYNIGVMFLGGGDDREALYYSMRMAEHPNIGLTVHRLIPVNYKIDNVNDKILDDNLINEYRLHNLVSEHNFYKEEATKDAFEIVSMIRAMENSFDLIIVGRRHDNYSLLLAELTKWNEFPELGFFGDMFASSDFKGNIPILVVQQHCISKSLVSNSLNRE